MKTTRQKLIGRCANLEAQVEASGHESRAKRAARLKQLTEDLEKVNAVVVAQKATIEDQAGKIVDLKDEMKKLEARLKEATAPI